MIDINPSQSTEKPLNLADFAQQNQITEDRVWELIEEGGLAARFVNDEILILREHEVPVNAEPAVERLGAAPEPKLELEPELLPEPIAAQEAEPEPENEGEPPLPNEDYHDLLLFAQDAMNRTMDLSHQLLATKDELLRMKDERIQYLAAELQKKDQEIRMLKGRIEDLETLCRLNPL